MTGTMHLLIIDDSEDDRSFYKRTLQKVASQHYRFSEAADGEEGIACIWRDPPACVLLDYSMPGRNGVEILKDIRRDFPFIPVVILTGQGNEQVAVTAIQEGAQNYIAKSTMTPETLEHVIRLAITHCALEKRISDQRSSLEIFTRALAHDLKEPVRTIRSYIELIARRETFSGKTEQYFNYVQTAADRVNALIDTVYFYTRLEGSDQIPYEWCDLIRVLEEVKTNISQLVEQRNAVITSGHLPKVWANYTQLVQVLQNLICNSITYSGNNPKIHVDAQEESDSWKIRVRDEGQGIAQEDRERIFLPFKRLTHNKEGFGLGLAICKKIIESLGGKIWCEPAPEKGTLFIFTVQKTLPLDVTDKTAKAKDAEPTHTPKELATILLVDDSEADLELTQIRLIESPKLKCRLLLARNGEEALAQLRSENEAIDLMLLDINMPRIDGFEVLQEMRKDPALAHIAVVMCTGSIYDKDIAKAESLGAVGYLVKPAKFEKLESILETIPALELAQEENGERLLRAV